MVLFFTKFTYTNFFNSLFLISSFSFWFCFILCCQIKAKEDVAAALAVNQIAMFAGKPLSKTVSAEKRREKRKKGFVPLDLKLLNFPPPLNVYCAVASGKSEAEAAAIAASKAEELASIALVRVIASLYSEEVGDDSQKKITLTLRLKAAKSTCNFETVKRVLKSLRDENVAPDSLQSKGCTRRVAELLSFRPEASASYTVSERKNALCAVLLGECSKESCRKTYGVPPSTIRRDVSAFLKNQAALVSATAINLESAVSGVAVAKLCNSSGQFKEQVKTALELHHFEFGVRGAPPYLTPVESELMLETIDLERKSGYGKDMRASQVALHACLIFGL